MHAKELQLDVLYGVDRNFRNFDFIDAVLINNDDLVLRFRTGTPAVTVVDKIPLTAADAEAGVVSDRTVTLPGRSAPSGRFRPGDDPSQKRHGKDQIIRLLTT